MQYDWPVILSPPPCQAIASSPHTPDQTQSSCPNEATLKAGKTESQDARKGRGLGRKGRQGGAGEERLLPGRSDEVRERVKDEGGNWGGHH